VDDTDSEKLKYSETTLFQCHFIHNKLVWVTPGEKQWLGWNHTGNLSCKTGLDTFHPAQTELSIAAPFQQQKAITK